MTTTAFLLLATILTFVVSIYVALRLETIWYKLGKLEKNQHHLQEHVEERHRDTRALIHRFHSEAEGDSD